MGILSISSQELLRCSELRHPAWERDTKSPESKRAELPIVAYFLLGPPPLGEVVTKDSSHLLM